MYGADGTLVATLGEALGSRKFLYGRLFELSPEILEAFESVITMQLEDFERARKSAEDFNKISYPPGAYYGRDLSYVDLPQWIKHGVALLAKLRSCD